MNFVEAPERQALREAVAELAGKYGHEYYRDKARSGGTPASCGTRRAGWATSA